MLGVKKKPWWLFILLPNYLVPLLHCLIGIGNQLLAKFRAIINEHIAEYSLGEEAIHASISILKISSPTQQQKETSGMNLMMGGKGKRC